MSRTSKGTGENGVFLEVEGGGGEGRGGGGGGGRIGELGEEEGSGMRKGA